MDLAKADIKLETNYVGYVQGKFHIPSFQRGYRWGIDEVTLDRQHFVGQFL